ncbi:MAG: hypothetical protein NC411_03280 [Bacteroides sp.]|nr:hypothetical protein [Bacteroides sp.]
MSIDYETHSYRQMIAVDYNSIFATVKGIQPDKKVEAYYLGYGKSRVWIL